MNRRKMEEEGFVGPDGTEYRRFKDATSGGGILTGLLFAALFLFNPDNVAYWLMICVPVYAFFELTKHKEKKEELQKN